MIKAVFFAAISVVRAEDLLFASSGKKLIVLIPGKGYKSIDFKSLSESLKDSAWVSVPENTGCVEEDVQRAIEAAQMDPSFEGHELVIASHSQYSTDVQKWLIENQPSFNNFTISGQILLGAAPIRDSIHI